jgi:hypothetical protein
MSIAPERIQPRSTYVHVDGCRAVSTINLQIARELADDHESYEDLYCTGCRDHQPIEQFAWVGIDGHASDRIKSGSNDD